ncbi:ABC transporter substrate-binding protein [Methanosarcina horonobensis]|uniref:ABC transporter substrate-binding protein n=1 Tax=Methanosarcina horonobensis TaxID=418008 RepID=UPI000ACD78DD|nr:ABC transporter substrate-binding protein [Methanosarcina horonobensis]
MKKINVTGVFVILILAVLISCVAFSGCTESSGSSSASDASGTSENNVEKGNSAKNTQQQLVVGEVWGLGGVDPGLHSYDLNNFLVSEGLTSISPDYKLLPAIADSWEYVENSTWRFYLNENVEFHDGSKVTANDVKTALDRSMKLNPDLQGSLNIKEVKVVDDSTVDIITNTVDASLPGRMAYGAAGIYKNNEGAEGTISTPICTGPFKVVSYDKAADTLKLVKNENYRDGAPKLDSVVIKFGIGEPNTREMAVEKGEVDFTTEPTLGSTKRLESNKNLNVTIHPLCQGYKLKFGDVSKAPYDDVRVRRAIAYAIDRQKIVDNILLGRAAVSDGNGLTPGIEWRNNDLTGYAYDVQRAKGLLEEAGWKDTDGDGIVDKEGQKFKITLYTWPQRPALPPLAQATQSMLKDIGIESEVRIMEWDAISDRKKEWGMIWVAGGDTCMMIPDPSYYIEGNFYSEKNDYNYSNPNVDALIMKGRTIFDKEERYDAYREVQRIVYDEDCAGAHCLSLPDGSHG